jgi:hypothetical protein
MHRGRGADKKCMQSCQIEPTLYTTISKSKVKFSLLKHETMLVYGGADVNSMHS